VDSRTLPSRSTLIALFELVFGGKHVTTANVGITKELSHTRDF
jgi:hypothetical protein